MIQQATSRGFNIVVNVHYYQELMTNPDVERPRFQAIWKQIAQRYKNQPSSVIFELYNEPNTIGASLWKRTLRYMTTRKTRGLSRW